MEDITLELPTERVEKFHGISFDVGSSVWKLLYLPKDEWERICELPEKPKTCSVKLTSLSNTNIDKSLDFIEENCAIIRGRENEEPVLFCTGITANQQAEKIKQRFFCRLEVLGEGDCFANGLQYLLKNVPKDEVVHGPNQAAAEYMQELAKLYAVIADLQKQGLTDWKVDTDKSDSAAKEKLQEQGSAQNGGKPFTEIQPVFPCLHVIVGSAFGWIKAFEDGSYEVQNVNTIGGRSFIALSSLLCKTKSWGEIMKLVEEGDNKKVDFYSKDFVVDKDGDDIYSAAGQFDDLIYSFGKAGGKSTDDFENKDLASALLSGFCISIAQMSFWIAVNAQVKHVFVSGSFAMSQTMQDQIAARFDRTKLHASMMLGPEVNEVQIYFLRAGSHVGAIGAAVNHLNNWVPRVPQAVNEDEKQPERDDRTGGDLKEEGGEMSDKVNGGQSQDGEVGIGEAGGLEDGKREVEDVEEEEEEVLENIDESGVKAKELTPSSPHEEGSMENDSSGKYPDVGPDAEKGKTPDVVTGSALETDVLESSVSNPEAQATSGEVSSSSSNKTTVVAATEASVAASREDHCDTDEAETTQEQTLEKPVQRQASEQVLVPTDGDKPTYQRAQSWHY